MRIERRARKIFKLRHELFHDLMPLLIFFCYFIDIKLLFINFKSNSFNNNLVLYSFRLLLEGCYTFMINVQFELYRLFCLHMFIFVFHNDNEFNTSYKWEIHRLVINFRLRDLMINEKIVLWNNPFKSNHFTLCQVGRWSTSAYVMLPKIKNELVTMHPSWIMPRNRLNWICCWFLCCLEKFMFSFLLINHLSFWMSYFFFALKGEFVYVIFMLKVVFLSELYFIVEPWSFCVFRKFSFILFSFIFTHFGQNRNSRKDRSLVLIQFYPLIFHGPLILL